MSEEQTNMSTAAKVEEFPTHRRIVDLSLKSCLVDRAAFTAAIGKLSAWGLESDRFCRVHISGDEDGYLEASYCDDKGNVGFVMGAVYRMQSNGKMGYDFNS